MPTTLTITVRYADGTIETFTNCIEASGSSDDLLDFTGSLSGGPATEHHKIKVGAGMRVSRKQV